MFKFTQVNFNPISFMLSRVFKIIKIPFAVFFVKVFLAAFPNIYDFFPKPFSRTHQVEHEVAHYLEWGCI